MTNPQGPQPAGDGLRQKAPHPRCHRQRGAALLMAVVLATLVAMLVAGSVLLSGTNRINALAKGNSEAALLLAEAGLNAELAKVNVALAASTTAWDTPTSKGSGSLSGVPGTYTVWTSDAPTSTYQSTTAWGGTGHFWITCTATSGGATNTVYAMGNATVTASNLFNNKGVFTYDAFTSGNVYAFELSNNAKINIGPAGTGTLGTNGRLSYQANCQLNFYNGGNYGGAAALSDVINVSSPSAPISSYGSPLTLSTVPSIIRVLISATSGMTDANTWAWMAANIPAQEKNTIYTWSGGSTTLSTSSSTKAFTTTTPSTSQLNSGFWSSADVQGTDPNTGHQCIILQPGDYYFGKLGMTDSSKELIIDNAGLTMVGGNPTHKQIRIWVYASGTGDSSNVTIPITFTAPNDPTTFRLYYANNQGRLQMNGTSPSPVTISGSIYAYAGASPNYCKLDFTNGYTTVTGSVLADDLMCNNGTLNLTYSAPGNAFDPGGAGGNGIATIIGSYYDGGSFGG